VKVIGERANCKLKEINRRSLYPARTSQRVIYVTISALESSRYVDRLSSRTVYAEPCKVLFTPFVGLRNYLLHANDHTIIYQVLIMLKRSVSSAFKVTFVTLLADLR
jgi:hypothetical protein